MPGSPWADSDRPRSGWRAAIRPANPVPPAADGCVPVPHHGALDAHADAAQPEGPHRVGPDQQARGPVATKATHPSTRGPTSASPSNIQGGSRMRECRTLFARGDGHPVILLPGFLCCDPMTSHFRLRGHLAPLADGRGKTGREKNGRRTHSNQKSPYKSIPSESGLIGFGVIVHTPILDQVIKLVLVGLSHPRAALPRRPINAA
jgi:hypothetical protein